MWTLTGQISVTVAGLLVSIFRKCTCSFRETQCNSHGWNVWCPALASKQPRTWRKRVAVSMKQDQSWADNYWSIWGLILLLSTLIDIYLLFSIIKHQNSSWDNINILTYLQKWPERLNCYHGLFNPWNPCLWSHQCLILHCGSRTRFLPSASDFQSTCDSIDAEMTRLIPHVMRSHMKYKCIFIWVLNWYVLPPTHPH